MSNSKKIVFTSAVAVVSFLAGFGVSSHFRNGLAQSIPMNIGCALVGGGATWYVMDKRMISTKTKLKSVNDDLSKQIDALKDDRTADKVAYNNLLNELNNARTQAEIQLNERANTLTTVQQELSDSKRLTQSQLTELKGLYSRVTELSQQLQVSQSEVLKLTSQVAELNEVVKEKEYEIQIHFADYQKNLKADVDKEIEKRIHEGVEKVTKEQFALIEEVFATLEQMDNFVKKIYHKHMQQEYTVKGYEEDFITYKNRLVEKHNNAYNSLADVNEDLENKILRLNGIIVNGLIEPIKQDYPFGDTEGKFVNKFIDLVWSNFEVPLKGLGYKTVDDITYFACNYPLSMGGTNTALRINSNLKDLQTTLGLYSLKVEHDKIHDCIAVSYRINAPKPPSDDDIYKQGLIPASLFCDTIFKATDHTTQGKPTLRIMAATGEGKGIVTKNLVGYFSELEEWEIWISDPLHGSDQDYWDAPKIATDNKEAKQAYKLFHQLHRTRKDDKVNGFTDRYVLGIFDEFDKQHSDTDKETAKDIMTALRHTKQRQMLIGQCAEVGSNGWSWDDMKNCSMLVLGDSIGTLCKHLVKDLGWTIKKSNEVKRKYEKFSDWAQKKNESNPDIPNENAYRIGLLVVGSRYDFLELPNAHKGIIRSGKGILRDSLSINTQKVTSTNSNSDNLEGTQKTVLQVEIKCPHCESTSYSRNGKTKTSTPVQKYVCKNCSKSFTHNDLIN